MTAEIIQFPRPAAPPDPSTAVEFWIAMGRFALVLGKTELARTALECAQRLNRERARYE